MLVIWCWLHGTRSGAGGGRYTPDRASFECIPHCGVRKGDKTQPERLTALEAHRAGKLYLPPGYELEYGADVLLLRRHDGSVVAAFSARAAAPSEVARTAEDDYRRKDKSSA